MLELFGVEIHYTGEHASELTIFLPVEADCPPKVVNQYVKEGTKKYPSQGGWVMGVYHNGGRKVSQIGEHQR